VGCHSDQDLPVPRRKASAHARVYDDAGLPRVSRFRHLPSCLLLDVKHQRPELVLRRSIPSLRTPLSTLRLRPHDRTRMTRGRCGSLRLHRDGLPPSTFRRSPGAPVHSINSRHRAGLFANAELGVILSVGYACSFSIGIEAVYGYAFLNSPRSQYFPAEING